MVQTPIDFIWPTDEESRHAYPGKRESSTEISYCLHVLGGLFMEGNYMSFQRS